MIKNDMSMNEYLIAVFMNFDANPSYDRFLLKPESSIITFRERAEEFRRDAEARRFPFRQRDKETRKFLHAQADKMEQMIVDVQHAIDHPEETALEIAPKYRDRFIRWLKQ